MNIVILTTYISVIVQLITGLADVHALTLSMPTGHNVLKEILSIEFVIQLVELLFYVWFIVSAVKTKYMASIRYFDWVITTPTMLLTTIVFMKYTETLQNNKKEDFSVGQFIHANKSNVISIFMCNLVMLVFGYLGETQCIPKTVAVIGGFLAFAGSFYVVYNEYARKSDHGKKLYVFLLIVWSLYGFAFMLNAVGKNVAYNFLDIIAKNFFGLYLVYVIYRVKGYF